MSTDVSSRPPALTRKGRATRDRIVAAAAELMYERGVAGTSVQDVQQAARVSGSQLYHYFSDKAALVRAVIARQAEAVLGGQRPWLSRLDSLESLRAWRDLLVNSQRRRQCQGACPIGSLASELADTDAQARADLADTFGQWAAAIGAGLQAMQDRGDLRPEAAPGQLAFALLAAAEGGLLLSKTLRDTAPLEAALDTVIRHIGSLSA